MIIYWGKYAGRDIQEIPSGYLVWLLEEYEKCDYLLREACKKELSHRLSLSFDFHPTDQQKIEILTKNNKDLVAKCDHYQRVILMSIISKGNRYTVESYLNSPALIKSDMESMKFCNTEFYES